MIDILQNLDASLLLWLNSFHNPFWDILMNLITNKWAWVPMYATILYVLFVKYGFKITLLFAVSLFLINFAFSDYTCGSIIRSFIHRPRPSNADSPICNLVHIVNNYRGGHYGFPSCHASNSFALATMVYLFFRNRKLTLFIYLWAFVHSYSRIYLGVHYPADILVGAIIGSLGATAIYFGFNHFLHFKTKDTFKHINVIWYAGISIFSILIVLACLQMYL